MISSSTMATGSYGIYSQQRDRQTVTIWFCGGRKPEGDGQVHDHSLGSVCAHATRDEARHCSRKPVINPR